LPDREVELFAVIDREGDFGGRMPSSEEVLEEVNDLGPLAADRSLECVAPGVVLQIRIGAGRKKERTDRAVSPGGGKD